MVVILAYNVIKVWELALPANIIEGEKNGNAF
jgi:hypothetical protein